MSETLIGGQYVRNLSEDVSQGQTPYASGQYSRAVIVSGMNAADGLADQGGVLRDASVRYVMTGVNANNIPTINVLTSSLSKLALAILAKYGTDAHLYLPGVGTISGITAGNYLDSAGTTPATVDQAVGRVLDPIGSVMATQSNSTKQPTLRRGAVNLFNQSRDFSHTSWVKTRLLPFGSGSVANAINGPEGLLTADKIVEDTSTGTHETNPSTLVSIAAGAVYTSAVWVKAAERNRVAVEFAGTDFTANTRCFIDLTTGVADNLSANSAPTIASGGNGWYLVALTATALLSKTSPCWYLSLAQSGATRSYVGDGASGVYLGGAAFFIGSYTAAQILAMGGVPETAASYVSTALGPYNWQFDGVDDALALGATPFLPTESHCVVAGVSAGGAGSTYPYAFAMSSSATGVVSAALVNANGLLQFRYKNDATTTIVATVDAAYNGAPVVASLVNISGSARARKNGAQVSTVAVSGAFTATAGMIGNNGGAGGSGWRGFIGPVIAIKGTVSDSDLLVLERFVGSVSGVVVA